MRNKTFITKKMLLFVLCMSLCMAQFILLPAVNVYADEDNDDDDEDNDDDDKEDNEDRSSSESDSSSEIEDIKRQIEESKAAKEKANQTKSQLASGMASVQQIIGSLQTEKNNVVTYVATLDAAMEQIQDDLDAVNESISENEAQIEEAKLSVEKAEEAIDEAEKALEAAEKVRQDGYENIKDQVKFMYLAGKSTFLEILVTSESVSDLLNRTHYISKIMDYDKQKLEEYAEVVKEADEAKQKLEDNKLILEEKQKQLEERQEQLEEKQAEAQGKKNDMSDLINAKEAEIGQYNAAIGTKEQQVKEYQAMIAQQDAEIAAIEQAIRSQQAALAEASRRVYGGGQFVWPAPKYTRISDDYGMRTHPTLGVQMMHNGIDMAAPSGSPILAAADGTVIAASYSSSMGNYIMIDHGSDIITIYMHASSLSVSAGQEVSAGDRIGSVGSTGRSTGPHLHFGVRKNGAYVNPWTYLK